MMKTEEVKNEKLEQEINEDDLDQAAGGKADNSHSILPVQGIV